MNDAVNIGPDYEPADLLKVTWHDLFAALELLKPGLVFIEPKGSQNEYSLVVTSVFQQTTLPDKVSNDEKKVIQVRNELIGMRDISAIASALGYSLEFMPSYVDLPSSISYQGIPYYYEDPYTEEQMEIIKNQDRDIDSAYDTALSEYGAAVEDMSPEDAVSFVHSLGDEEVNSTKKKEHHGEEQNYYKLLVNVLYPILESSDSYQVFREQIVKEVEAVEDSKLSAYMLGRAVEQDVLSFPIFSKNTTSMFGTIIPEVSIQYDLVRTRIAPGFLINQNAENTDTLLGGYLWQTKCEGYAGIKGHELIEIALKEIILAHLGYTPAWQFDMPYNLAPWGLINNMANAEDIVPLTARALNLEPIGDNVAVVRTPLAMRTYQKDQKILFHILNRGESIRTDRQSNELTDLVLGGIGYQIVNNNVTGCFGWCSVALEVNQDNLRDWKDEYKTDEILQSLDDSLRYVKKYQWIVLGEIQCRVIDGKYSFKGKPLFAS
jgi:hypothetical protein